MPRAKHVAARIADQVNAPIGARIRKARRALRMSQEAMGAFIGISASLVGKHEKGKVPLPVGRLMQIADLLKMDVNHFISGIELSKAIAHGK